MSQKKELFQRSSKPIRDISIMSSYHSMVLKNVVQKKRNRDGSVPKPESRPLLSVAGHFDNLCL